MAAKIEKNKVGELASKAFYTLLKTSLVDESMYAGVSYFPDSDWNVYAGSRDSESTFWGGADSDYGELDKIYYDQSMYSMHKVLPGGISRVAPRRDWNYGTIYKSAPTEDSYVLVKEYTSGYVSLNVYKCLFSPRTSSLYQPSGSGAAPVTLSDGYVWKYMYTITNSESLRFLTDKWMPVSERITQAEMKDITTDSPNYSQYISQINAEQGAVYDVIIDSDTLVQTITNDSDLRVAFNWTSVNLIGIDNKTNKPSKAFRFTLQWNAGSNKFTTSLIEGGQGYVGPVSIQLDSDSGAINGLSGVMAPGEGHGANVPAELKTNSVVVSIRNIPDEANAVVYNNSMYNMISLHLNPIDKNTGSVAQNEFYVTCNSFDIEGNFSYSVGEEIRPYYNDDGRRGLIISTKGERVYYISTKQGNEFDVFSDSETISLVNGNKVRDIKKAYNREINFNSSDLLVADYKQTEVVRGEGQIESFNFILSF